MRDSIAARSFSTYAWKTGAGDSERVGTHEDLLVNVTRGTAESSRILVASDLRQKSSNPIPPHCRRIMPRVPPGSTWLAASSIRRLRGQSAPLPLLAPSSALGCFADGRGDADVAVL